MRWNTWECPGLPAEDVLASWQAKVKMPSKDHESSELDCWHPKIKQYGIKCLFKKKAKALIVFGRLPSCAIFYCKTVLYKMVKKVFWINVYEILGKKKGWGEGKREAAIDLNVI